MRKVTYEAPTDGGAIQMPAPPKVPAKKAKAKKAPAKKKKAAAKPEAKKATVKRKPAPKSKKPVKRKATPAAVVARPERLDLRLTEAEKGKLVAKAAKTRRTITSVVLEMIEKLK